MDVVFFWNFWRNKTEMRFYVSALVVFAIALVLYFTAYFVGNGFVVRWEKISETKAQSTVIDSFEKNLFEFQISADSFLIIENFKASDIDLNFTATYVYLFFLLFGLVLLFTSATFLSKTWYYVICALFIFYLTTLNSELLYLFGSDQKVFLIIALIAYFPMSYYFNAFANDDRSGDKWKNSFLARFLIFALITFLLGILVVQFSQVPHPEMFIVNFGIVIPLVLTATFIGFNAHEVVNGFLYLVTNSAGTTSKNTPMHFIVLTSIYLLNLLYAYLVSIKILDFGILYINAYFLVAITLVLGVWGFAKRSAHYAGIMDFAPVGAFLYISLAIISLATLAYFFAVANDPLAEVMEDIILYTHFGFGFGFFGYVITNFYNFIKANKKVSKVVYQPNRLDFIWVYVIGGVVIFLMMARASYFIYNQSLAGYYNGLADTYKAANDLFMSEQYYKTSVGYEFQNHKANYTLGVMAKQEGKFIDAFRYFEKATLKQPSPYTYAQMTDIYMSNNQFLEAIFKLREGVNKFPKSGELSLKMGILFTNTNNLWDSAFYYFDRAKPLLKDQSGVAAANIYATLLKNKLLIAPDSIKKMLELKEDLNTDNNELVLFNNNRIKTEKPINAKYLPDSLIFAGNLCYFYNYALNRTESEDAMVWDKLNLYRKIDGNGEVSTFLDLIYILRNRKIGENTLAYKTLDNLYNSLKDISPYYGNLAGLLMIEQDNFPKAINYLASATRLDDKQSRLNYAIALSEVSAERSKAIEVWNHILNDTKADSMHRFIAKDMLRLIHPDSVKKLNINILDDISKYRLAHYNQFQLSDIAFNDILKGVQEPNYQLLTTLDRINYYLNNNQPTQAEAIRNALTGLNGIAPEVQQELIFTDLKLLYKLKKIKEIGNLIEEFKPTSARIGYKNFYKALVADTKNDTLAAVASFQKAIQQSPFNIAIPMELAAHYNQRKQGAKAYETLVEALELYPDYHEYPTALYEMYLLQCLEMRYISFAEDGIARLEEIAPKEEFAFFKKIFDAEMAKVQAKMEVWE
jgi:hypothetical protein